MSVNRVLYIRFLGLKVYLCFGRMRMKPAIKRKADEDALTRRSIRFALEREYGCCCQICGTRFESGGGYGDNRLEVHHRVPIKMGGDPFDRSNLMLVCRRCHREIHENPWRSVFFADTAWRNDMRCVREEKRRQFMQNIRNLQDLKPMEGAPISSERRWRGMVGRLLTFGMTVIEEGSKRRKRPKSS